ncbi:hypothetical protein GCM10018781_00970 [Kitasatospora indigofera]|uniref:Uncharacterized protein n=1 Tax=Kitasatospora indigofera TaxID=67307 RepID=A0A919KJC1_9ACTN|nr:hypothetical protein GCM10018781_00970 [Kitasatospora indigofera]
MTNGILGTGVFLSAAGGRSRGAGAVTRRPAHDVEPGPPTGSGAAGGRDRDRVPSAVGAELPCRSSRMEPGHHAHIRRMTDRSAHPPPPVKRRMPGAG